jgi:hypothetical protein
MSDWLPAFLLPNILVDEPIESEFVVITSTEDPRCAAIASEQPTFATFISRFKDAFGRAVTPSILLVRKNSPPWVLSMDALAAFRDTISISAVTYNKTHALIYPRTRSFQYSTYFDFYAWTINKDFTLLTTNNPALWGMDQVAEFQGQPTAGLAVSAHDKLELDKYLLAALLAEWKQRFSQPDPPWQRLALFRSLNMAHAAAQIPGIVDISAQSLGRSISLWVSAFEILVHPGDRDSNLKEAYGVFDRVDWLMADCRANTYAAYAGRGRNAALKAPKRNLACWVYGELFHARNDFLHGNAISDTRLVVAASGRSLFGYAPPLYRLALSGFLGLTFHGLAPSSENAEAYSAHRWHRYMTTRSQSDSESALLNLLKPKVKED